ncbi:MAG: ATP-binding cassette domain-containing protein, partial [Synergistaceae bacterium]|nr:ATP-binding cassette domain-containing protein [Synergistaceae bacterium]
MSDYLIEVKNLCKSFGDLKVLNNVNLSVKEGERLAIIGGSGCGKSVFLRSLELLEKPDSGQIFIDNQEITAKNADINKIRLNMGMVYQKFNLFSHMDVLDNLCLAPVKLLGVAREDAESSALEWLDRVGLTSKIHEMPGNLSGGQQQRIAICRCLMMRPKVLLFDEPTSALDPTMVGEVLAMIRMLTKRNMTMLIVTHEMNFAREVANKVLFFADHGIYEQGTPDEIFDAPKREKTIAFIRKLKYFNYEISSRNFDLLEMQGQLRSFTEKYGIERKLANRLELCAEELIYEVLNGCYKNIKNININMEISYSEADGATLIKLASGGNKFNPFEAELEALDEEHLGVTILKNIAKSINYIYENNKNYIDIVL